MEPLSVFVGLISGVLLAVITAQVNHYFDQKKENNKKLRDGEYEIYLKLSELYSWYFWFATNELYKDETSQEIVDKTSKIAFELGILVRENERSEFLGDLCGRRQNTTALAVDE